MKVKAGGVALAATMSMLALSAGAAIPEVTSAEMSQWSDRSVNIVYALSGAPAVITLDIQTNVTGEVWASIGGENIQRVTGDCWQRVDDDGEHTITWSADLDWPDHKISLDQGGVRAVVTAWALDNTPDYMVVNIAADATPNTPRYYPAKEFLPGGLLNNPAYRTTSIVMRKIMAKDVTWTMGSVNETGRITTSEATHQVSLTNNFYLGVFEVTQSQWSQVCDYSASLFVLEEAKAMRPVDYVSYNMLRRSGSNNQASGDVNYWPNSPYGDSFLGKLRQRTGIDFDLPGEAQWEFAARAGNGEGHWGNGATYTGGVSDSHLPGRYARNGGRIDGTTDPADPAACPEEHGTAIVGSYEPNAWGLYDMHGNVWEWCNDWWAEDISSINGAINVDPTNPSMLLTDPSAYNLNRVRRGGGWKHDSCWCRSAARNCDGQASREKYYGCRLACRAGLK